jgi:carboxylate-amine ligase
VKTGFIHTIREIWWDVRPHHHFGTVEVRVCDIPSSLDAVIALAALVQSLVVRLSEEVDEGTYLTDIHPIIARQNKWRAVRYGADAQLVDANTYEVRPLPEIVRRLVDLLAPTAEGLGCLKELESLRERSTTPSGAKWQSDIFQRSGSRREVVRTLLERSRLTPDPGPKLQTASGE